MCYEFKYETTALDFWKLSMYNLYKTMIGTCNIVFTAAMILLTIKFWQDAGAVVRIFMIAACCLFTAIQPIAVYLKAKKQVSSLPKNMKIKFDDNGVHVISDKERSDIKWKNIRTVAKKLDMIIIFSTTTHGFILSDNILGKEKEAFYKYAVSKINR